MAEYGSVYEIDAGALAGARPDLILTQAVCEVCAVPTPSVHDAVRALPHAPRVLSLDAHTLEEIIHSVAQVADAAGDADAGARATASLRARVGRVRGTVAGRRRPRVLALEWLDPPFAPGHWIPEMIELAGGECLAGAIGGRSVEIPWSDVASLDPDRLLLVPCGYGLEQAREDAERARERLLPIASRAIAAGGAAIGHSAWFSRSGPRVVAGIEALAAWLHRGALPDASADGVIEAWC